MCAALVISAFTEYDQWGGDDSSLTSKEIAIKIASEQHKHVTVGEHQSIDSVAGLRQLRQDLRYAGQLKMHERLGTRRVNE